MKAETAFNLRLNKQRNLILAWKLAWEHIQQQGHNFNKPAKFIIINKLVNLSGSNEK